MKIISVKSFTIPDIKIVRFARFSDHRGYFSEPYRQSDLWGEFGIPELAGSPLMQTNESVSKKGVIRGLHFQWNPFMGKLVRTLSGRMLDIVLDVRKQSPTCGMAILYDMPARDTENWDEWIWVPPGFAHGNLFIADTRIEYLCTGEYSPECEAGICPFATDIDWSLAAPELLSFLNSYRAGNAIISEKDANGLCLNEWFSDVRSNNFDFQ